MSFQEPSRPQPNASQRDALHGYRAAAILVVMLAHARFSDGYPDDMEPLDPFIKGGVTAFMVLSGYLVTGSLLSEEDRTTRIDLRSFVGGQIVRFFVPALAYLAIALLLWGRTDTHLDFAAALRVLWISPWTGDTNRGVTLLTQHLYSLAAQMQFCLIWPLILRAIPKGRRFWPVTFLMLTAATWRSMGREIALAHGETIHRTDYVLGSLMVGAWWAVAVRKGRMDSLLRMSGRQWWPVLAGIALALAFTRSPSAFLEAISPGLRDWVAPWRDVTSVAAMVRVGLSLVAMMSFGCLVFLLHRGRPVRLAQAFSWAGITWLGRISFSVYLWQNVFCFGTSNLTLGSVSLDRFPLNLAASVLFGFLAYRLVERPSLRWRSTVKARLRSKPAELAAKACVQASAPGARS